MAVTNGCDGLSNRVQGADRRLRTDVPSVGMTHASSAGPSVAGAVLIALLVVVWTVMFLAPTFVAIARRGRVWPTLGVNLLVGWSPVGWLLALVLAMGRRPQRGAQAVTAPQLSRGLPEEPPWWERLSA